MQLRRAHDEDLARVIEIWNDAVRATHDFLTDADIRFYLPIVRDQYLPFAEVWVAEGDADRLTGFVGLTNAKVDALFVDPAAHRQGIGRALLAHAYGLKGPLAVDVNEENHPARAFYARLGFREVGRSATDAAGKPHPLIHLASDGEGLV
ncbi:acetyltransferase [Caulobacter sp. 17J65-9]|uniref:acetyltransferase n=1 Tax=Caulobacter sp. 17J65-9 TaxID=2709382 RepID=UPI0013C7DC66|nr:acetyltransferase [Caulobacter sp. 17J65-9]NEX94266.1 acetyltransferase [Caulobacter sp. 17J65-9]